LTFAQGGFIVGTYKSKAMTYKATLKVHFDTEWTYTGGIYDDETLPEEHYTFEIPTQDINSIQLFRFFANVALVMGHNDVGIMKGACALAFNDMRSQEDMRKVAEEYDLKLAEDKNQWEDQYWELYKETQEKIADLKAKLSRYEQPDNPQYTDEEMDAMELLNKGALLKKLEKANVVCSDCGKKYGEYHNGVSSVWEGKCNVCDLTKSVTEVRDYGYLVKGIKELAE
jgi:hypothetical protein